MFEHRERNQNMKNFPPPALDTLDGDLSPQTSALSYAWPAPVRKRETSFTRISRVSKTGQPATGHKSHSGNIPEIDLTHTTGDPMETN
jgi:hypothetical protein